MTKQEILDGINEHCDFEEADAYSFSFIQHLDDKTDSVGGVGIGRAHEYMQMLAEISAQIMIDDDISLDDVKSMYSDMLMKAVSIMCPEKLK